MNFTDDKLDDLFRSELDKENSYNNAESQWPKLSNRLNSNRKNLPLFWFLGIGLLAIGFCCFFVDSNQSTSTQPELISEVNAAESITKIPSYPNQEILVHEDEKTKAAIPQDLNTKEPALVQVNNNSSSSIKSRVDTYANKSSKEVCDCPDDLLSENVKQTPQQLNSLSIINDSSNLAPTPSKTIIKDYKKELIKNISLLDMIGFSAIVHEEQRNSRSLAELNHQLVTTATNTTSRLNARLYFGAGGLKDIYNNNFKDSTAMSPYFSLGIQIKNNLFVELRYNQQNHRRILTSGFEALNLVSIYGLTSESEISRGLARYKEQTFDFGLKYKLKQVPKVDLSILGGLQINRHTEGTLDLNIVTSYLIRLETSTLVAEPIKLRNSYLGVGVGIPIISSFTLELQYRRIIPLVNTSIDWGQHNRISLGFNYQLNINHE